MAHRRQEALDYQGGRGVHDRMNPATVAATD